MFCKQGRVSARNICRTSDRSTNLVDNFHILMTPLKLETRRIKNNDQTPRWCGVCENKDTRVKFCKGRDDAIVTLVEAHGGVETCTIEIAVGRESVCVEENFQSRSHRIVREGGERIQLQSSHRLHTNVTLTKRLRPTSMRSVSPRCTRSRRKERAARKVCCALCGVIKYTPPVKRKLARRRVPKVSRVCVKEQDDQVSGNSEHKPRKLVIWLRRYPKVKLCDIARVFEISRHFSCSLPPALFTFRQRSGVHCFKRQILALMCQELLGDGNASTSSVCQSQDDNPSVFSCGSGSGPNDRPSTNTEQEDIKKKRKRQITDEVFHITNNDEDHFLLPCEVDTCQRARVFVRRNRYLCSRTYITWPFNRNDPPPCVMSPPCRSSTGVSASLRKPCVSSPESRENKEDIENMVRGHGRSDQVVVPSLLEESGVKSSAAQGNQLTCTPGIFHQTCYDLTFSESARKFLVSEKVESPWLKKVTNKPTPAEQDSLSLAQCQDPPRSEAWSIGGRLAVDSQSTTSSEDDLSIEDKTGHDEVEDEDTVSSDLFSDVLDPIGSPCHEASAVADSAVNELQVHEQDAIVLDVIDDDPDLFGSMMTEIKEKPVQTQLSTKKRVVHFTNPSNSTKEKLSDTDRYVGEPTVNTEVTNSLQCEEEAPDYTLTRRVPGSSWTQVGDMYIWGQEGEEDQKSGWNSWRNLPSNVKQNTCNTVNFTPMKTGGPSRPAPYGPYCKYYFSENRSCLRMTQCSFLHVPRSGDEKFCMSTVQRFTVSTNAAYVKRAVDVFTGYYKMCSPGLCFNVEVVTGLLASLIRLGFLSETFLALNLLLRHNIQPPTECVLAVFEHSRERKFNNTVPQLIYLISKVVETGCVLTVDQCERLQRCLECLNAPKSQMDVFVAVKCRALANIRGSPEMFNVAHAFIDLELCKKQEDWKQMAAVFVRVCASPCTTSHLLKFCASVATALLVEPSQSRSAPYSSFAEAAVSQVSDEGLDRNFLGRIGISMLIHYYKTQQWCKGQRIVDILSQQQPCYSVMKGVFSNEDSTSRCCLITMATELHLHCGSMEGALNVLKENNWFVSCSKWPCERGDVVHRVAVQTRLAQCTSNRDALEVLMHLPGLQPLGDSADVGDYTGLFNSLLRSCLERTALLVAADTLDFMLTNGLRAELLLVQNLICDLGKRNRWNRARILFQRALKVGYYPLVNVAPGSLVLELPSSLNEVEMAVCLEMFISRNIPHSPEIPNICPAPVVTLKRASSNGSVPESEYLSAGCRLLSSAQLANPKLRLSYTTVNSQQEQVYTIEAGSAHNWLSYNHSWALRLWSV
ncbi:uncharacterized protein topaz1 isoform X2 [Sardina pilchardus]|uniref:uncharacterized protein topaz1 isoform X2 n=1 Tax=Sardina pilchardus TaxID=27697 RepID=UPI002E10A968